MQPIHDGFEEGYSFKRVYPQLRQSGLSFEQRSEKPLLKECAKGGLQSRS